jgi:hypothetical protein
MRTLLQTLVLTRLGLLWILRRKWSSLVLVGSVACVIGVLLSMLSVTAGMLRAIDWARIRGGRSYCRKMAPNGATVFLEMPSASFSMRLGLPRVQMGICWPIRRSCKQYRLRAPISSVDQSCAALDWREAPCVPQQAGHELASSHGMNSGIIACDAIAAGAMTTGMGFPVFPDTPLTSAAHKRMSARADRGSHL